MASCAICNARSIRPYSGNTVTNGPSGLQSVTVNAVDAGAAWADFDFDFAEQAKANAEAHNTEVVASVCSPTTAVVLSTLKEYTTAGSNRPLLQGDPQLPGARVIAGVLLLTSPAIDDDIVWAIPPNSVVVALRQDASVVADTSASFTSDRTAIRATLRISWGFTDPAAISKVTLTA